MINKVLGKVEDVLYTGTLLLILLTAIVPGISLVLTLVHMPSAWWYVGVFVHNEYHVVTVIYSYVAGLMVLWTVVGVWSLVRE